MTKQNLLLLLSSSRQVLVDTEHKQIGTDENNLPVFELKYINPPQNYKLIRVFEHLECAILEDLDYKEVVQDEPTTNT